MARVELSMLISRAKLIANRALRFLRREKLLTVLTTLFIALVVGTRGAVVTKIPQLINAPTLASIVSLLLVSKAMECSGLFSWVSVWMISRFGSSPTRLGLIMVLLTAMSSSVVMNDNALLIYVPLTLSLTRLLNTDPAPLLTLITVAANLGSSLTPIGNPQNIVLWRCYGVPFHEFVETMTPFVAVSMAMLVAYSRLVMPRKSVGALPKPPPIKLDKPLLITSVALLCVDVVLIEMNLALPALVATVVVLLLVRRELVARIDLVLVAIFALIFIDFGELSTLITPLIHGTTVRNPVVELVLPIALSQVVSNVPATILLLNHVENWKLLALGVNIGGLGFVIGSLANIITLRLSRITLRDFHRYAVPFFAAVTTLITLLVELHAYPNI